ncbi:MAG: NUDIX hydrolase [Acidimicrobiia bacterium]
MEGWLQRLATLPKAPDVLAPEHRAAVLVPLYEDDEELRVVLIKRPVEMPTHGGQIAFPGGMVGPDDGGPVATALREAGEEVALSPRDVEVLGVLEAVTTASETMVIVPVVGRLSRPPRLVPDPREVERILQPAVREFFDESRWWKQRWWGRDLWFFNLGEEILWGATALIVRDLMGRLRVPGT